MKEVEWAAKRKIAEHIYEPVEDACSECHFSVKEGWCDLDWRDAVAKALVDGSFKQDVVHANNVRAAREGAFLVEEKVITLVTTGRETERYAWSYSKTGFSKKYGQAPDVAGYNLEEDTRDEFGNAWEGVTIFDDDADEIDRKRVRYFHQHVDQYLLTGFKPERAVRRHQGRDHFHWLRNSRLFKDARERSEKQVRGRVLQLPRGAASPPPIASAASEHEELGGHGVGDIIRSSGSSTAVNQFTAARAAALSIGDATAEASTIAKPSRGKRGGAARAPSAHGGGGRGRGPRLSAAFKQPVGSFAVVSAGDVQSSTGGQESASAGEASDFELTGDADIDFHLKKLSVPAAFAGTVQRLGNLLNPAETAANNAIGNKLRKHAGQKLATHIKIVAAASSLSGGRVASMSDEELSGHVKTLQPYSDSIQIPYTICLAILRRHAAEKPATELVDIVWPCAPSSHAGATVNFQLASPKVQALPGDDEQKASAFLQMVIADRLLSAMSDLEALVSNPEADVSGKDTVFKELRDLATSLLRHIDSAPAPTQPVFMEAIDRVKTWTTTIAAIAGVIECDVKETLANARALRGCGTASKQSLEGRLRTQLAAPAWNSMIDEFYTCALEEHGSRSKMAQYMGVLKRPASTRAEGFIPSVAASLQAWQHNTRAAWRAPLEEALANDINIRSQSILSADMEESSSQVLEKMLKDMTSLQDLHASGGVKDLDTATLHDLVTRMKGRIEEHGTHKLIQEAVDSVQMLLSAFQRRVFVQVDVSLRAMSVAERRLHMSEHMPNIRILVGLAIQQALKRMQVRGLPEANRYHPQAAAQIDPVQSRDSEDRPPMPPPAVSPVGAASSHAAEEKEAKTPVPGLHRDASAAATPVPGSEQDSPGERRIEEKDNGTDEEEEAKVTEDEKTETGEEKEDQGNQPSSHAGNVEEAKDAETAGERKAGEEKAGEEKGDEQQRENTDDTGDDEEARWPSSAVLFDIARTSQALLAEDDVMQSIDTLSSASAANAKSCEIRNLLTQKTGKSSGNEIKKNVKDIEQRLADMSDSRIKQLFEHAQTHLGAPSSSHAEDMCDIVRTTKSNAESLLQAHAKAGVKKLREAMTSARDALARVAGGGEGGISWKDGLPENASWDQVEEALSGLFAVFEAGDIEKDIVKAEKAKDAYVAAARRSKTSAESISAATTDTDNALDLARATQIEDRRRRRQPLAPLPRYVVVVVVAVVVVVVVAR